MDINSPEDIKNFLAKVINGVWSQEVPIPVGTSMGFLSRCWLDAYEKTDMEVRLKKVEAKLLKS